MANTLRNRKVRTNLKPKKTSVPKSTSEKLEQQIENYKTRLEATGAKTDKRNFIEKALNLPEGQNALFDIFEVIGRPQQALFGAIDSLQKGEDVIEGFNKGIGGIKKTSGGQLLRNAGMEGSGKFNLFDPSTYGELSASDVLGLGLDLVADPIDIPLFKTIKVADKAGDVAKTAQKTKTVFAPFEKGSKSTLEAGMGLVAKGAKKTAKLGDNVIEKALGNIDAKNIAKYKDAVEKYGVATAREMYKNKSFDLLDSYRYMKKNVANAVDYTKALPGDIIDKAMKNKNIEQKARIQMGDIVNASSNDIRELAEKTLKEQGVKITEESLAKKSNEIATDLSKYIEIDSTLENTANSMLSKVTHKNKTIKGSSDIIDNLDRMLKEIPATKGTYEITEDGIKFNDEFLKNKNIILKDPKYKEMLQKTKIQQAKNYTEEQLAHHAELAKNKDFMDLVEKRKNDYTNFSKILKEHEDLDFSSITDKPGYVKKARGNISKEYEDFIMGRSSSSTSKINKSRKYASGEEAQNALEAKKLAKQQALDAREKSLRNQLSEHRKQVVSEEISQIKVRKEKYAKSFETNVNRLDEKAAKAIAKKETLTATKQMIKSKLTDDIIDKASKMQDKVLSDGLFKASNKVAEQTKAYNNLLNKLYKEGLSEKEIKSISKQIEKLDDEMKASKALLEGKIAEVRGAIDNTTIKEIENVSKSLDKYSDVEKKIEASIKNNKEALDKKLFINDAYNDRMSAFDNMLEIREAKLRGISDADDAKINKELEKIAEERSMLASHAGEQLFDLNYNAGLREFIDSELQVSTTARNFRDALLDGVLEDPNLIKQTKDLDRLPTGQLKVPKGWVKVNGSDIYDKVDSFKEILPDSSSALLNFGNNVKGKTLYMPKELSIILDVAPNIKQESGMFVKFVNGWNNIFKRFKTLTPGFHLRNITGNASNMYLSGVPMKDIPVYYGKATQVLNDAENLYKKAAKGLDKLTDAERKQYNLIDEFIETGFFKRGSELQELEDIQNSIKKGSKNIAKKGLDKVSEVSMNMNTAMDNYSRMALYMYAKDHPEYVSKLGKKSAADAVKFALFDPSNMTDIEKKYMRSIVPFYNFTKQNLLFQSSNIIKNTTKYNRLAKAINMAYDGLDENSYYQYQKEGFQIPTPFKDSKGNQLFMKTNLPLSDLGEYIENPVQRGLSSVTPIIKAPIEKVTGKDLFTGQDVNKKSSIDRIANYLGINTISTDLMKKINAIQNSNLSDNEKWAEILRSMLQNTNEEKVKNNKLYQELEYYQNRVNSLKNQGINVPTIKELTEQSKSNVNRLKKKRARNR